MKRREASSPDAGEPRIPGRFAYGGLERLLHEKARLSILSSLAAHPRGLLFNDLKGLCALTDGNLSRQLRVLEEAGLVEIWKGVAKGRPKTLCRLTGDGRQRFADYIAELERVVADAAGAKRSPRAGAQDAPALLAPSPSGRGLG